VLQEKELERLGSTQSIKIDVRVIAATNRDLMEAIQNKLSEKICITFACFPYSSPAFTERQADITLLVDHFLDVYAKEHKKDIRRICTPAIDMLMSYHWPGNVRNYKTSLNAPYCLPGKSNPCYHLPPTLQTASATHTNQRQFG